ncbi:tetratricopeptide repeat protein [Cryptosporangium arvum]|uniref:tetratricopeptide repeat protein n=1 Tax=Cryptosporangium arvum TaxID=80871 RepID=UPI000687003F|nr:tetratricopeptide repeat protein [Cryptosporangium arvum]
MFRWRRRSPDELYREGRRLDLLGHELPSVSLFEQAAVAGHGPACNELGKQRIRAGKTIEGLQWLRRAADAGVPEAALNLAAVHTRRGQLAKATELRARAEPGLRAAAEAGDLTAALALRRLYRDRGDTEQADAVVTAAEARADASATPDAWCGLGALLDDAGRPGDARPWWRRAAEAGHAESMYLLGLLLHDERDPEGLHWLEQAARHDNAYAMGSLAQLALAAGDERAGERWLRRAARAGFSGAMNNLAVLHSERGERAEAERWYQRAVDAGDPQAEHHLRTLREASGV